MLRGNTLFTAGSAVKIAVWDQDLLSNAERYSTVILNPSYSGDTEEPLLRNRRAPNLRSPLAFVPLDLLISSDVDVFANKQVPVSDTQRRPGPDNPQWKIPYTEWSEVLRRVGQGETYRQIASHYGVSYEAIRRLVKAARREKEIR